MRLLLLFALCFLLNPPVAASDEGTELQKRVDALVNLYSDGLAEGYPEYRHVTRVKLFDGSSPDAVVLFAMEGFHGGNGHEQYLAVFASVEQEDWPGHELSRFRLIGVQKVGARWWRALDPTSLRVNGKVLTLASKKWSDIDPGCCPSQRITKSFVVSQRGIAER